MNGQNIENHIDEFLDGDERTNALKFVAFLRASEMQFERGKGYWGDKRYWLMKYQGEYACYVLVNGYGCAKHEDELDGWTIWLPTDDNDAMWYRNFPLENRMKKIAWENVDICAKCSPQSPCRGGFHKMIFGREFDSVCRCTFRFDNPDAEAVNCAKKLVELRKNDIIENLKV